MPKNQVKRCIVTFARSWSALAATRCLGKNGVEVITCDTSAVAACNLSHYSKHYFTYPDPQEDTEGYLSAFEEACKKYQLPDNSLVLMPLHVDSFVVAAHRERFDGLVKMAIPDIDQIDMVNNKSTLAKYCLNNGIHTPPAVTADSADEFKSKLNDIEYPAFIKLPESLGAIGIIKVKSAAEAEREFDKLIEEFKLDNQHLPMLQQGVDGDDFCSTFLFANGVKKASMTYHNIMDYPKKQGMGAIRETVDASEMEEIGADLLQRLKWHGVAEIDFRWNGKSAPWLIEVNPRFWGGLAQSIASGIDYPYMLYKLALDGDVEPAAPTNTEAKTFNPCLTFLLELEEFIDAKSSRKELSRSFKDFKAEIKNGHLSAITKLIKGVSHAVSPEKRFHAIREIIHQDRSAVNELLQWRDPMPLLGLLYPLAVFIKHGKVTPELLLK